MFERKARARWEGTLEKGRGMVTTGSGVLDAGYSFKTRFGQEKGTNPEELIGAAHAGCFSMALSAILEKAGYPPVSVETGATVVLEKRGDGFAIARIELSTEADVPGIDEETFLARAREAKEGCPVSRALASTEILLEARLA